MRRRIGDMVGIIRSARRKRRRVAAFMLALSCMASGSVFWQLRSIGTAMTDQPENSDDTQQICDSTEAPLSAGEIAAETELHAPPDTEETVCTDGADRTADTEKPLPEITAESLRDAVAEVARSQIGYTESEPETDGTGGYTRFGEWFGDAYCEWNTAFTCFCLNYAGVPECQIPCGTDCAGWSARLLDAELLLDTEQGIPEAGDLIFIDTDADGTADRSGIVIGTETDEEGAISLTVAEGDCDGAAAANTYLLTDLQLIGYVPVETETDAVQALSFESISGSGVIVSASAPAGAFPDGTEMTVTDIPQETAFELLGSDDSVNSAVAVDITFRDAEGTELEPADDAMVQVRITLPDAQQLPEGDYALHHQLKDGTVEEITDSDLSARTACFSADSFSIYVVTSTGARDKDVLHEALNQPEFGWLNGDGDGYIHNSDYWRYLIKKGDKITIVTKSRATEGDSGYPFTTDNKLALTPLDVKFVEEDGVTYRQCTYEVEARNAGDTEILLDMTGNNNPDEFEHFYIHVMENDVHEVRFSDIIIGNQPGCSVENPLVIVKGETVVLREEYDYIKDPEHNTECFYTPAGSDNGNYRSDLLSGFTYYDDPDAKIRYATFTGVNNDDNKVQPVSLDMSRGFTWTIYVKVSNVADNTMTHADIEIADGGHYKQTHRLVNPDGSYTETVTMYDVCVADVNHCDILNAKGDVISSFNSEHYYRHGTPGGSTQFELTSNYIRCEDQSGNTGIRIESTGEYVTLRDDPATNYTLIEADTAVFDVKLLLEPVTEIVTRYDANGQPLGEAQTSDIRDRESITIDSVVFNMDHQSVIDAHNKCPAHTGLDFTLNADLNEVLTDKVLMYTLPATGGNGTPVFYMTGIVCMAAAYLLRRRRRKTLT